MRHAGYLSPSRHGIFYFRHPIPSHLHPYCLCTDVKLSLRTRCPKVAAQLSQVLLVAGQSLLAHPTVQAMNYKDIREHVQNHFRERLAVFKFQMTEDGPISNERVKGLQGAVRAAECDLSTFVTRFSM